MCLKAVSEMTSSKIRLFICGLFNDNVIIQTVQSHGVSALRVECGLKIFENNVLRRVFAPKGEGEWRK